MAAKMLVSGPAARARRKRAGLAALLALATLALYLPATGFDFITFDDQIYVTRNSNVLAGVTLQGLRWSLTAGDGGNWHPLTWWSHMLDVSTFGPKAGGHHLTSVLIHTLAAVLLYLVLAGLTGATWPSFFAAALFALHPLHVESVAWISERKDVLAAFFWIATLGAYLRCLGRPGHGRYPAVIVLFACGLMSKPMVVTLPLVLLLLDFWPLGRFRPRPLSNRAGLLKEKMPLFFMAAAAGLVTVKTQLNATAFEPLSDVPQPFRTAMLSLRLSNAAYSYVVYLGKTVWPVDLAVFYPYPSHTLSPWRSVAAGLLLVVITVLIFRWRRRAPCLVTGWLWYLITLLPVIGLLQVGAQARADRYTYLPLVGVFLIAAWGARDLSRRRSVLYPAIALLAAAAIAAIACVSARQLSYWRNGTALFEHALAVTSDNHLAHRILGEIRKGKEDFAGAEGHFREALRLTPRSSGAHNRLGMALSGQGRLEEAVVAYRTAADLDPRNHEALNNLGVDLTALGRLEEAERYLRAAARLSPGTAEIYSNLGDNLARQVRTDEAERSYRTALELKPDLPQARTRLDRLLNSAGGR